MWLLVLCPFLFCRFFCCALVRFDLFVVVGASGWGVSNVLWGELQVLSIFCLICDDFCIFVPFGFGGRDQVVRSVFLFEGRCGVDGTSTY